MAPLQKYRPFAFLIIAFTISLYALAARDGHNWKGDFSQYIMHAQNLVQGKAYSNLGVLSIDNTAHAGIPPGYPLIIVPVLKFFGLNFIILKIQIAFIFGLGLLIYWYETQKEMPIRWSLGTLAFLAFTPWVLKFSNNVLTDIPYLTASLFTLYWGHKFFQNPPTLKSTLYLSLSLILACSFRSVGVIIIGTVMLYAILLRRSHLIQTAVLTFLSFTCTTLIYRFFEAGGSYVSQFSLDPYVIVNTFLQNLMGLERSFKLMIALYPSRDEDSLLYSLINTPTLICYMLLMFLGFFRSIKKRGIYLRDIYLPLGLLPLLLYPYPMRSRYLLPLLPFTHLYVIIGFRYLMAIAFKYVPRLPTRPIYRYRTALPALLWMPLFLAYWGHYTFQSTTAEANILKDPDVQSLFQAVRNNKQDINKVLFWRPRILHLFTEVNTAGVYNINQYPWTPQEITHITNLGVSHLILDPYNPKLAEFTHHNPHQFKSIYKNNTFHLMRIIPPASNVTSP